MTAETVHSRSGTEADALGGVIPTAVTRPGTTAEVADLLRSTRGQRLTVVPVGAGSKTGWAAPPTSCDLLVELTALDRVVEHTPGDLVVIAEAGVRLTTLQAQLAAEGQLLGLDPAEPTATLGGIVSANASGPRRLRYGTVRDLLIGVTVVLADGSTASAGGKVVKNVAGYDLGKLYTGAHGTLGIVVSTTWRLHPLPSGQAVVLVPVRDASHAGRFVAAITASTLTPSACELGLENGELTLAVLFEAIAASVEHQADTLIELLGAGAVTEKLPSWFGRRPGGTDDLVLRLAYQPAALSAILRDLPAAATLSASACTGVAYLALPAEAGAAYLPALRTKLMAYDGTAVVLNAPAAIRHRIDHWGPVGDALALMGQVKDRFDPDRRLSPGRFVGGL